MATRYLFLFLFAFGILWCTVCPLCPLPPMVADAIGNTVHTSNNSYYIEYNCIQGYYIANGDSRLKCSNGTTNGTLPTCMMVTCNSCKNLVNGKSNCNSSLTYDYNSTVEYWCDSGYKAHGSNILTCGANGSWVTEASGFKMKCQVFKTYRGCYNFVNASSSSTNMFKCRHDCQTKGFHFAGFNNAGCACWDTLTTPATGQCQQRCHVEEKETCGGTGGIRTVHYSFYGCYSDSAVPKAMMKFPADSTKTCIEYCRLKGARYALLLHSDQCSCTNVVSKTAKLDEKGKCMHRNYTDTYFVHIVELEKTYMNCGSLYNDGVRWHGEYLLGNNQIKTKCNFKDGTPCDQGWIGYNGACYQFSPNRRTFQESLSYCAARNSDLVSIHDQNENNFLKSTIKVSKDLRHQANWFIGLHDNFQRNSYIWLDGTLKIFQDFLVDYPSEHNWPCVYLNTKGWLDTKCQQPTGLICKKKQDTNQCLHINNAIPESKFFVKNSQMNPGLCFQICRGVKLKVSAVNNVTCYCFLTLPPYTPLNWTECSNYCSSNTYQNCGGGENIYFVTKENGQHEALSCYELQLQEMANRFTQDSTGVPLCKNNSRLSCPHTWLASQNSCYKFFESRVLYTDAVKQCIKNNAYLVSIKDADEESRLSEIIKNISVFKNIKQWWIGLSNVQNLGVFRWSNGQPVTYNKINNINNNFVIWNPSDNTWKTHNSRESFICEKDSAFHGCYTNNSPGLSAVSVSIDMTINMCVELCRGRNINYTLLAMYQCFCSNVKGNQTTCSATNICKAQPNQLCGKYPVFAVYQVDKYEKFANTCQDLLFEGISVPAVYDVGDKRKNCDFKGKVDICPSDTRPWIGFEGMCYLLINKTTTWDQAQNYCVSINSTLASIRDYEHYEFLKKSIKPRYSLIRVETIWLGGSDELLEGFYTWVDGNLLSSNQSLHIGTGKNQHLALLKPKYKLTKTARKSGYILCQITKEYQGCFETIPTSSPNITILVTSDHLVSVNLCKQLCLGKDFKYSLTNQKSCACTNNNSSLREVHNDKCRHPCPTERFLSCGSQDKWTLHLLDNSGLATTCYQLALNGIFLNATYKLWNSMRNSSEFKQCGASDNSSCPIHWIGKDGVCYYFSTHKTSLSEARKACFLKSAILSFPINAAAREFIGEMIKSVPSIWHAAKFFVGVQTFNRGSYIVSATGRIFKPRTDISARFKQLVLSQNIYSQQLSEDNYFICEKFSGYKGCASLSNQEHLVNITTITMTATQCLEFCRGQGFSDVAVNVTSCFCLKSDSVVTWHKTIHQCLQSCPGFDNQPCGGKNVFSVYEIDPNSSLPESCAELANLGVTVKSTYQLQPTNNKTVLETSCFSTGGYAESIHPKNYTFTSKQSTFKTSDLWVHIIPTMSNAWKPTSVSGQWVEVALPSLYVVTGIQTRGVMKPYERWVKSYELFYGDVSPGYLAPYSENGKTEFQANTDGNNVVTRLFRKPFVANTIRLVVKQSQLSIALGFQFLGQEYQNILASNNLIGCFAYDANSTDFVLAKVSSKDNCKTICQSNSYPMYGIQEKNGNLVCVCAIGFGKYGQLNDSECHGESMVPSFMLYRTFDIGCTAPQNYSWAKTTPLSNPVRSRYGYKMKVMYTCFPGYEFPNKNDSAIIKCLLNDQWEPLPGNCSRKHCQEIPNVNQTITDTNDTYFGSKVTYQCQSGLMFPNYQASFTIECLGGTWNTTVPSCVGFECQKPSPLPNSKLISNNGTYATFACIKGFYFLDGLAEKTFICQQNITWSFNNEECKAPDQFQRQKTVSQGEQNKKMAVPSHSLHARSLLDCISKCMQHMSCSVISLYTGSSKEDANCDLFLGSRTQITLASGQGWNMYYLK